MKVLVLLMSIIVIVVGVLNIIAIPFVDVQVIYIAVEMEESFMRAERQQLFDQENMLKELAAKNSALASLPLHGITIQRELFPLERLSGVRRMVFIALIVNAAVLLLGGAALASTWIRMFRTRVR